MVSFYGGGGAGSGGGGSTPVNVGIVAKEGYSEHPINLYTLPDGNYNLLGNVIYGDNKGLNFLSYKTFVVETIDGIKIASYEVIEGGKPYKVIIEMPAESTANVKKIEVGGGNESQTSVIDDTKQSKDTTYSSFKIEELLSWVTS